MKIDWRGVAWFFGGMCVTEPRAGWSAVFFLIGFATFLYAKEREERGEQ